MAITHNTGIPTQRREGERIRRAPGRRYDFVERPDISTTADEAAWLMTVTDTGSDSSEVFTIADDEPGGALKLVTNDADNDALSMQLNGEAFSVQNGRKVEYEITLQSDDVSNTDLAVGFAVADTDILGGVTDALMFRMDDGSGNPDAIAEKDSTETSKDTGESMADDEDMTFRIEADSSMATFFINESEVARVSTNIPDDEALSPFIEVKNRSAAARTVKVKDLMFVVG